VGAGEVLQLGPVLVEQGELELNPVEVAVAVGLVILLVSAGLVDPEPMVFAELYFTNKEN
jgi:hypothetical protein